MADFRIQLREYITKQPNGDRSRTGGTDCSNFKVVLISVGGEESVLKTFAGFDNFHSSHKSGVREEAEIYLAEKATFFGAEILPAQKFRPMPPRPVDPEWLAVDQ